MKQGNSIIFDLLVVLITWWPLTVPGMVIAGFLAARVRSAWARLPLLGALIFLAPLLIVADGLVIGCFGPGGGGERCFGTGFGLVVALMYGVPLSALLVGAGVLIARVRDKRRRPDCSIRGRDGVSEPRHHG